MEHFGASNSSTQQSDVGVESNGWRASSAHVGSGFRIIDIVLASQHQFNHSGSNLDDPVTCQKGDNPPLGSANGAFWYRTSNSIPTNTPDVYCFQLDGVIHQPTSVQVPQCVEMQ